MEEACSPKIPQRLVMTTENERIMTHFNTNTTGCKRRRESKPRLSYEPGCRTLPVRDERRRRWAGERVYCHLPLGKEGMG